MSVHYKFKSSPERYTVIFDGLHISVADLKKEIMKQRKIGKSSDLDLQIINSQTKEVYTSDNELIPKNTSVEVARVPVAGVRKNRERIDTNAIKGANSPSHIEVEKITKSSNISTSYATEEEKIKAMMTQSTQDYDTSKYAKNRGPIGPLPPNYTCYRCGNPGHYIKQCPTNNTDVKRSTGIPRSFMIPANADQKGALLTASGEYAVPIIDHQAYKEVKKEKPPFVPTLESEKQEVMTEIPDDIKCLLCGDLLQDAVLIPCCGNSFCDECIRNRLLESETHECPECHETEQSPDSLIPNRFLRNSVSKFRNDTGYSGTKTWSEPLNNVTKPIATEQTKPEPLPLNDVKLNDVSNSPKPVDNELKSQSPKETAVESPIIETNGPSDVTMDEVLLESTQKDQKSEENVLNGQMSGLSDELLSSQSSNDTKEVNETTTEGQNSTIGSDNQIIGEQLESYESIIDPNSVTIEGNPVMSLAQYPTQHMIPGYPRPPRMMANMGPIRTIRTTVGQQPNQAMIGRPPPAMMPHPRGGVYPRTGMPAGYRQMTDPRGFPMGMPHNMAPYGYPPQMRPNAYHDPYGYMGPRSHMTAGAMHPMAMSGMGEAPPPGSAPIMADPHYQYTKTEYDDYEDRFNRFTRQLESRSRGRPKRNRSISRTRSRTRSPNNRMSRSRSSSTSSSTSSSSSSSSFSFSSRSRSFSPRRRSRSRSHYRNRRSRSPSPRYGRGYGRDYRYRRSRSPVRGSDSRRYTDRNRDRYEREKDPKYKDNRHNDRNDSSHRSSHRSDDKKKESKQTHSKNSSKAQDKSRDSDKSKKKKSRSKTPTKDENNDNKSSEIEVKTETIENKNEVKPENDSNKTQDNNKSSDKSKRRRSRSSTPTKDEVNDKSSEEVLKTESNENKDKTEVKVENESKSDDKNRSSDKSKRKKTRTKSPQKENSSDKNSEAVLKTVTKTVTNESKDKSDVKVENESNKSDKKSSDKSRSKRNRSKSPPKEESNNKSNEVVVKSEPKEEKRDKSDHKSEKESKKSKSNDNKSESKDKNKEKSEKEKSDDNPDRSSGKDKKKSKEKSKKHHKHHHKHHHHKHRKSSDDKEVKDSKESKDKKDDSKSSSSKRSSKKSSSSSALKSVVS